MPVEETIGPRSGANSGDKWRLADMEDRNGDPGKGVMRAKGKRRETTGEWAGGRKGGREEGGRNCTSSEALCTLKLPALSFFSSQVLMHFPAVARIQ